MEIVKPESVTVFLPWRPPAHYPAKQPIGGARLTITAHISRDGKIQRCICPNCGRALPFPYFIKPTAEGAADLECHQGSWCNDCEKPKRWEPKWKPKGSKWTLDSPRMDFRSPDSGQPIHAFDRTTNQWVRFDTLTLRSFSYDGKGQFNLQPRTDRQHSLKDGHEYKKGPKRQGRLFG